MWRRLILPLVVELLMKPDENSQQTSEFKVTIATRVMSSCSNQLVDSRELGFFRGEEETTLLVVYSRSSGGLNLIVQDTARPRRQVETAGSRGQRSSQVTFDPILNHMADL